ncbi:MAG TPA: CYTH domain-containing protein, partial [Caldimonas sp.]|nr:CYTH domain-containing protein [Caldimonas sp.]
MSEQELKLHVPSAHAAAIARELLDHGATRVRLRAIYFDTPERELARARVALRLRLEGRRWMQTLKTPGADAITRVELNHPRPGPTLDLSV